jgi:hypothetical protein
MSTGPDTNISPREDAGDFAPGPSKDIRDMWQEAGDWWTTSLSVLSAWSDTWQAMLQKRGGPAAEAMLKTFYNPATWPVGIAPLMGELQDVLALPHFADLPRLDASALPSAGPFLELVLGAQQYLAAAAPVWVQVSQRFQAEVQERRSRGEKLDSAGEAMDLWNNVLDRTLMEFNRSEEFAKVQQRFLHAAMRQRREVRNTFERAATAVDLPTRTEMTDVYQRLHDLLRQVHNLRREVQALRAAQPPDGTGAPEQGRKLSPTKKQ